MRYIWFSTLLLAGLAVSGLPSGDQVWNIGTDRQLFLDQRWLAQSREVTRRLHAPLRREVVIENDRPWDSGAVSYMVTFRDGDRFRAWYRADSGNVNQDDQSRTAYAESRDGIHWVKPDLGLIPFEGSTANNLVWPPPGQPGRNLCIFKDERPGVPADELYKATGWERLSVIQPGGPRSLCLLGFVSPDGLRWRQLEENPIYVPKAGELDGYAGDWNGSALDTLNMTFWDPWQKQYVGYWRANVDGIRMVMRVTSDDFRTWSRPRLLDLDQKSKVDQFYTSSAIPYLRAPGTYLMFPSRFVGTRTYYREDTPGRPPTNSGLHSGVNDILFLSSRDGIHWDRSFREAFLRPGLDPRTWYDRSLYLDRGILQTSPEEISLYVMENVRTDDVHLRRVTLRTDGFVSVQAGAAGGEFTTPPLRFEGSRLEINFSTSAAGSLRVEIQDSEGRALPGFSGAESEEIYGDQIERAVTWTSGPSLSALRGKAVRLRFLLQDADLYAFRFAE